MNNFKFAFIWLVLAWVFLVLGLFTETFRSTLLFSVPGAAFSTPISVGLFAVRRVGSRRLGKALGVFLVGVVSAIAALFPPLAMSRLPEYHVGDAGMAVLLVMLLSIGSGFAGFLIMSVCISRVRITDDKAAYHAPR